MEENWYVRLKECRIKAGYSLRDIQSIEYLDMSQQSLIKYEQGIVFPRINILDKMCKLYGTTIDYIIYGTDEPISLEERTNTLVSLFSLLHSKKITLNDDNSITINDSKLAYQIKNINLFNKNIDIASIDAVNHLLKGIKKLSECSDSDF